MNHWTDLDPASLKFTHAIVVPAVPVNGPIPDWLSGVELDEFVEIGRTEGGIWVEILYLRRNDSGEDHAGEPLWETEGWTLTPPVTPPFVDV